MSGYGERFEKEIDSYYGEYKKGLLGKKCPIRLCVYSSHIEGMGYVLNMGELANESDLYSINYSQIRNVYEDNIAGNAGLVIEYIEDSIVVSKYESKIALLGITEPEKWIQLLLDTRDRVLEKNKQAELAQKERKEAERKRREEKEAEAEKFYLDCLNFHIKDATPRYELYRDKNKIALIYIEEDRSLNFLKIDGDNQEESNGVIPFDKIHYYEKAGDIHYVAEIHGDYSSYGGSVTGGKFSKLATVGGGLLFGMMGMTAGALLSYKPAQTEGIKTNFTINSDTKKIDERSVMLNFYSDMKKQYVDIELPNDIYNFLQTHLPEKKYNIVLELEKKTAIHQATDKIESGELLRIASGVENKQLEDKQSTDPMEEFKKKVEKLKLMKDAGLLSDEEFNIEKAKLLNMI